MDKRDVSPDESILNTIFTQDRPEAITVIVQDWDKCVFKAEFPKNSKSHPHKCIVRLESGEVPCHRLITVAALQEIAAGVIPKLVPRTLQIGNVTNAQGRAFQFSVVEFVEGDTLEDAWDVMNSEERNSVVVELVTALKQLHAVQKNNELVQKALMSALFENDSAALKSLRNPLVFGGPHSGFVENGSMLLDSILEMRKRRQHFCTIEKAADGDGITIESEFEDLGSITIKEADMANFSSQAVLCHNDLAPRNILLQKRSSLDGREGYKLAGIIDWELAGFYPASYELGLQDAYLGCSNRHISFYVLLKSLMREIVPQNSSQVVLVEAMNLIYTSQQRFLLNGGNIPAHIRKQFIETSELVRDQDPYVGWRRSLLSDPTFEWSSASFSDLEDNIIEKMLARRGLVSKEESTKEGKEDENRD